MLLLASLPLLMGALLLVNGQTLVGELLLSSHAQWTWAQKPRASEQAAMDVSP
jgi:hypothetical protein